MRWLNGISVTDIAGAVLAVFAIWLAGQVPSLEIAWVMAVLALTVFLFAFEVVPVDVAALSVMVLLGLTTLLAPAMGLDSGLVPIEHLFDGFASNAVISIIAVMIIGAALDKTGLMTRVASLIMRVGGRTEARIIPLVSSAVAAVSSFMQNVGAAALFLPLVSRISARTGLPMSRLLMPMGFCAILGGTITMVGSSPLILLNDLIKTANQGLPPEQRLAPFGLFSVAPIGLALVATGILFFVLAGRFALPARDHLKLLGAGDPMAYYAETYGVSDFSVHEARVPAGAPLAGLSVDAIERRWNLRVIAVEKGDGVRLGTSGVDRTLGIEQGTLLGILGTEERVTRFVAETGIELRPELEIFAEALSPQRAGIAEIVIPPGSGVVGKSARDLFMRKVYGLSLLAIRRGDDTLTYATGGVRDLPFKPGDTLVVHTAWADLARLESNRDFVVVTTEYPHEELRPHKLPVALLFFALSLGLVLFSDLMLSVALLTGAVGMVLSGVLSIDEAYEAVSWKTVFLLASLIPLGLAVEQSGTAAWIAQATLTALGEVPIWVIQAALAVLATFFTLVMSNVGATVLLVPLAVKMALGAGADPAMFALTVGIATSNSFLIPTHQVNALIMVPGGYRVPDYLRAGGIMTVLFLVVSLLMLNLVF
ncbi:MAG: SLC13 family permease [Halochromatium sp.]|uniref:SLC13 family permease n=1 Tax=Halochromatium sp. TaxID=2049430 RepID=UPI0039789CBC